MASAVSTQRSCADLVLAVEEEIPRYLGFEGVGVLFKDTKTNGLFSLQPDYNEDEFSLIEKIKGKRMRGEELTTEERIKDFER